MELTLGLVLLAGLVSFASPCFLPVVPVFVSYLAGQEPSRHRGSAVGHAAVFMLGFGTVFVTLWALVGLVGYVVGDYRALLRILGGTLLVMLGLHTTGLLRIGFLDRVFNLRYAPDSAAPPSLRRSVLLGLAFGAGWTPCIGPVLGGVLGLATTTSSLGNGVGLLIVYALGLGIPFILICGGVGSLTQRLSWFTKHQRAVSVVTGVLLIVVGFLMISDLLSWLAAGTALL